jgi:IclR family transcriptional regulator, KDG regulon repressor
LQFDEQIGRMTHEGVREVVMLLTITSAGRVLGLFTATAPEHGVTEVSAELGVSKSKAHALLASLADVGLLRRTDRSRYRLGWQVLSLSRVLADTTDFQRHARPVMQSLAARLGELVHLSTLDADDHVCVEHASGRNAPQPAITAIGGRRPAHCSAGGKALLAFQTEKELDRMINASGLPKFTSATVSSRWVLEQELARIRASGYAVDRCEGLASICCVAAPIFPATGCPPAVAAISIAVPSHRFVAVEDSYIPVVARAAAHITKCLRQDAREASRLAEAADAAITAGPLVADLAV